MFLSLSLTKILIDSKFKKSKLKSWINSISFLIRMATPPDSPREPKGDSSLDLNKYFDYQV